MKIQICGPSGAGKTTMAKFIAEEFRIPYVHTDGPGLRKKYNCKDHNDVIKMSAADYLAGLNYQYELRDERINLAKNEQYVMDRSFIDNVAYFLLQNSAFADNMTTLDFVGSLAVALPKVTHIIFIPPLYSLPENDGVRIQNGYYQGMTYEMMKYVSHEFFKVKVMSTVGPQMGIGIETLVLNQWDFEWRMNKVRDFLTKNK